MSRAASRVIRARRRRSFVLVAVLLIMAGAFLVATNLLFMVAADLTGAANAEAATQSRLLAWSGVQALMGQLDEQRDRILDGAVPFVEAEYVIYEDGHRAGVVRLLPVTPAGELLAPEAGRLDLNHVDAEALAATGLVDPVLADAIIAHRDRVLSGSFQSVAELLQVEGMTPDRLYGPLEDIRTSDEARGAEVSIDERLDQRLSGVEPRGLADVVTVYAVEPALQQNGVQRINLNVSWSDELGRRLDRRFGDGAGQLVKGIIDNGVRFESDAVIFEVMRDANMEPEEWADPIDALTTEQGVLRFGRLDINTASREALAALPGLDDEAAAGIVRARAALGTDERATVAWPAIEGIVEPEAYDELAGRITTRSWTYRVRVAAGERVTGGRAGDALEDLDEDSGTLESPIILEAVIDLSDPTPRLAYLRDVTRLQMAARMSRGMEQEDEREPALDEPDVEPDDEGEPGDGLEPADPGSFDEGVAGEEVPFAAPGDGRDSADSAESAFGPDRAVGPRRPSGPDQPAGPDRPAGRSSAPAGEPSGAPAAPGERVGRWRRGR